MQFLRTKSFYKHLPWRNTFYHCHFNSRSGSICTAYWKYASKAYNSHLQTLNCFFRLLELQINSGFTFHWQRYLQSTTIRLEEWRIKRIDTEQWMHHRQLAPELRHSIRKFNQYKWVATRGVDEEAILRGLPSDLRREIKRHLCLKLVRRVSSLII